METTRELGDRIAGPLNCPYCRIDKKELVWVKPHGPWPWACEDCARERGVEPKAEKTE